MGSDIVQKRLENQQLTFAHFTHAEDVVNWFGAMQAQDFAAAKWAIALRTKNQTDHDIEQAFNEGKIIRTHIMRPTWHFVTPSVIRWLLALTSERVHAFNGYYYRQSGLDKAIFQKSNEIIRRTLQGGKQCTREQLRQELEKGEVPTKDLGLSFTIMQAELDGIICSGPRIGKQFTYMLLDDRVPNTKAISRDEALTELIKRYFQSHGPAQIQDFVWWSGLTVADAKKGIALVGRKLHKEEKEGKTYWWIDSSTQQVSPSHECFLIPGFDEYFIAYKERSDVLDKKYAKHLNQGGGMVNGAIVVEGTMVGGWKRTFEKDHVVITTQLFENITASQQDALEKQAQRYGQFITMPVITKRA